MVTLISNMSAILALFVATCTKAKQPRVATAAAQFQGRAVSAHLLLDIEQIPLRCRCGLPRVRARIAHALRMAGS